MPTALGTGLDDIAALPPQIDAAGHGLLPAVLVAHRPLDTVAVVYSTRDHGRHWIPVEKTPMRSLGGYVDPAAIFSFLGPDRVLVVNPRTRRTFIVLAHGVERHRRARRLPSGARLSFSGPRFGFALSPFGRPPVLMFSNDGGTGWTPITRNPG